jgi:hypothetical protein
MVNRVRRNLAAISDLLSDPDFSAAEFVEPVHAQEMLSSFRQLTATPHFPTVYRLWAIASLEAWLREILRYRKAASTR